MAGAVDLGKVASLYGSLESGLSYAKEKDAQYSNQVQSDNSVKKVLKSAKATQQSAGDIEVMSAGVRFKLGQNAYLKAEGSYEHEGYKMLTAAAGTIPASSTGVNSSIFGGMLSVGGAY